MTIFRKLWKDESGASAAEYALILAIVGTGIAFAAFSLGETIADAMGTAEACIENPPAAAGADCVAP